MLLVCCLRKKSKMELFSTTGFERGEKVFVQLDRFECFGVVVDIDDILEQVKVDFTSRSSKPVVEWFKPSFWSKVIK